MALHYDIYKRKFIWKLILFLCAMLIVFASLFYTNIIVKKISADERLKVKLWADAIERKVALVNYTNDFFQKIETEERKRVELWAEATKRIIDADKMEDLTFYSKIISGNTTIPVILTNANKEIIAIKNVDLPSDTLKFLEGDLLNQFSKNLHLTISYGNITNYLFYKESVLFSELRSVLNDLINSFFSEIVSNNPGAPVIITDIDRTNVFAFGNIDSNKIKDTEYLSMEIKSMESQNKPILIDLHGHDEKIIFYKDSYLLTQLRYYPVIQFGIIGIFLIIAYILFSISRRSEENQVWVGMAKETAHQLGTPISSMLAWIELIKEKDADNPIVKELNKDIIRLENITDRFSNIGSKPVLNTVNAHNAINKSIEYIKTRAPKKIDFDLICNKQVSIKINENLFGWVVENLLMNAIDAMNGEGKTTIRISENDDKGLIFIDFSDIGKGISKRMQNRIFMPGYTTKTRGWGLGLTLAKRIIKNYHNGKIFVKHSSVNRGTTFRIILKK